MHTEKLSATHIGHEIVAKSALLSMVSLSKLYVYSEQVNPKIEVLVPCWQTRLLKESPKSNLYQG